MRVILAGAALAIVISVAVGYFLYRSEPPVYRATAAPSVRIGNPGDNLVGPDWSGLYKPPPGASEEFETARQANSRED
jgi:hypothetical protein